MGWNWPGTGMVCWTVSCALPACRCRRCGWRTTARPPARPFPSCPCRCVRMCSLPWTGWIGWGRPPSRWMACAATTGLMAAPMRCRRCSCAWPMAATASARSCRPCSPWRSTCRQAARCKPRSKSGNSPWCWKPGPAPTAPCWGRMPCWTWRWICNPGAMPKAARWVPCKPACRPKSGRHRRNRWPARKGSGRRSIWPACGRSHHRPASRARPRCCPMAQAGAAKSSCKTMRPARWTSNACLCKAPRPACSTAAGSGCCPRCRPMGPGARCRPRAATRAARRCGR